MARLDDLITQIPDKVLRQKLEAALADMKRRQRFGLVFEEHVPETTALVGLPLSVGATVQRRSDATGEQLYLVKAINGHGKATLEAEASGDVEQAASKDLLVVKRFGDPIFPALTSLGTLRRGPASKPHHAVVNGENFHALQLFVYLYEGQIDCIYIDPPYNTGARDWKYNNRYVDKKDAWRHSKWLSMMEKRLRLAKRLLRRDGVLICTIDEHEVHHLGMLLERVFPEYLRHTVTIIINPKGTGKLNFARVDEYALFCVPELGEEIIAGTPTSTKPRTRTSHDASASGEGQDDSDAGVIDDDDEDDDDEASEDSPTDPSLKLTLPFPAEEIDQWEHRHARRRGAESSYRRQRPNQFYPIYVDPEARRVVRVGDALPLPKKASSKPVDGLIPVWPIDDDGNDRCWRLSPESMRKIVEGGRLVLGRYNSTRKTWTLNIWVRKAATKKIKTVWTDSSYDAGTHGTTLLHNILGRRGAFPFPKSVYAVRDCLAAVVRNRPDALILDFFAGSGTTFHATCLLNAEDGGRRRCVLVTNNEVDEKTTRQLYKRGVFRGDAEFESHGIFEQATRPRTEAVVKGTRSDGKKLPGAHVGGRPLAQGFEENVEFFRVDYLDADDVDLGNQFDAILPAMWLAAGGVGKRAKAPKVSDDILAPADSTFAVLFREERFRKLQKLLTDRPDITHVWLVTDSEDAFAEMSAALPRRLRISMLYRDYLRNFMINTRRSV